MNKIGNQHSSILDDMTKIAATKKKPESGFTIEVNQPKPKTLKELFAQFEGEVDPTMGDIPGAPMGDMPPEDELGGDIEGTKQGLCDALTSLCGSVEEAHACIDQFCGESMEGEGLGDEGLGEMPPEPMLEEAAPMPEASPMPEAAPMAMPGMV